MEKKYFKLMLLFFYVFFLPYFALAKDESPIATYRPASQKEDQASREFSIDPSMKRKIEREVTEFKNGMYQGKISWFIAFRKNDLSLCSTADCRERAENDLEDTRYQAAGECGKIKDPLFKKVCKAQKLNNCDQLAGVDRDFCDAFITQDVDSLVKVSKKKFDEYKKMTDEFVKSRILESLGIFCGFKYYESSVACEKYMSQINLKSKAVPFYRQLACELLFHPDVDRLLDELTRDFALFSLSRKENRHELCNFIKSAKVKKACLDPYFKNLDDLF